jgi:hypothetical protein
LSTTPSSPTTSRVVVVAGSGRSGTSTIAGVLKLLGLRIPPPEIPGNRSNPRGFFEPRWVVDFQMRLLRRSSAVLTDSRPRAFDATAEVAAAPAVRREVAQWLRDQLAEAPELVVKDPRNSWFIPLWQRAAADAGAEVGFLTMLRHPAEVVGSKDKYYKSVSAGETARHAQTTRVGSWLNVALFTEAMTRDSRRTFVLYNDLLADWRPVVARVVEELGLTSTRADDPAVAAEVDEFVDPDLRRVRTEWSDIECPDEVRDLAQEVWEQLVVLAENGGTHDAAQSRLDEIRARYVEIYADAEALAQSSADNARREGARQARRKLVQEQRAAGDRPEQPAPGSGVGARARAVVRRARGLAGRARRRVAARRAR